mmetsp:Transcript_22433/g.44794  ORF Transcript_22433/g.44794 Transcript_22433/m.44794 type:complete len:98 (-) Transcript_22433:18-311(-)
MSMSIRSYPCLPTLLLLLLLNLSAYGDVVDFVVTTPPSSYSSFPALTQYIEIWGIPILSTSGASESKLKHVAGVLAQFLDNDEDGCPDDRDVTFQIN